jgi:hypothetical protein
VELSVFSVRSVFKVEVTVIDRYCHPDFAAAMGATFAATESIVANQREKQDALNGVAGGCAAGFLAGIRGARSRVFRAICVEPCV